MVSEYLLPALVGLLPVLAFLGALLYLDSYKLVKLPAVIAIVVCGAMVAGISYEANAFVLDLIKIDLPHFSRYVAPLTEELLKISNTASKHLRNREPEIQHALCPHNPNK